MILRIGFGSFFQDATQQGNRFHVHAAFGRAHMDGRSHTDCLRQRGG